LATGVITALAIAAPVGEASADTPLAFPLPALAGVPSFIAPLLASIGPSTPAATAYAGVAIGDVFNGGTTVCVTTATSTCSVNASP
jgi:hypothetical protein